MARLVGNHLSLTARLPNVTDIVAFAKSLEKNTGSINRIVDEAIQERVAVPSVLAIQNVSSFGVRDLFVEIDIRARGRVEVVQSLGFPLAYSMFSGLWGDRATSPLETAVNKKLAHFEEHGLSTENDGWKVSLEWGALQPQRMRIVKPVPFVIAKESTTVDFGARVFADGFPQPLAISAQLDITIETVATTIEELVPDIRERLAKESTAGNFVLTHSPFNIDTAGGRVGFHGARDRSATGSRSPAEVKRLAQTATGLKRGD